MAAAPQTRTDPPSSPETILVIDDDEQLRRGLRRALERQNYGVVEARDGAEGLAMLERFPISVVLVDLRMPNMNGHGFMRHMRRRGCEAPLIVMTGDSDKQDVISALRAKAVDFLEKPFAPSTLYHAIEAALASVAESASSPAPQPELVEAREGPAQPADGEEPSLMELIKRKLGEKTLGLLVAPPVLTALRRVIDNPEEGVENVLGVIEKDQELALRILKVSNSSAYGGRGVNNLREGVVRLGGRMVMSLATTLIAERMHRGLRSRVVSDLAIKVWRRTVACARAARILSKAARRQDPDGDYLHTLLAEIGEGFLLRVLDDVSAERTSPPSAEEVRSLVAMHHSRAGGALLRSWQIAPGAIELAKSHHDIAAFEASVEANPELAKDLALMHLARHCQDAAFGRSATDAELDNLALETSLATFGLTAPQFDACVAALIESAQTEV